MSEHTAVMDHLLGGRADEAAAAMGRHIERGADTAAEWLRLVYEGRESAAAAATPRNGNR
jgi:DNA-binding FadR family transcriptional regulator